MSQTIYGGADIDSFLTLQGTSHASPVDAVVLINPNGQHVGIGGSLHDTNLHVQGLGTDVGNITHAQLVLEDTHPWAKDVGGGIIFDGLSDVGKRVDFAGIKGGKDNALQNDDRGYLEFFTSTNPEAMTRAGRFNSDQSLLLYKQLFFDSLAGFSNPGWSIPAIQMKLGSFYSWSVASGFHFGFNIYHSDVERYLSSTSAIKMTFDGDFHIRSAGSGIRGNEIIWTQGFHMDGATQRVAVGPGAIVSAVSAALDIQSTVGGVLFPRMTTAQRDALTPVNGMVIYNSTSGKFQGYEGGSWANLV